MAQSVLIVWAAEHTCLHVISMRQVRRVPYVVNVAYPLRLITASNF